jgi:hypothetical protein
MSNMSTSIMFLFPPLVAWVVGGRFLFGLGGSGLTA